MQRFATLIAFCLALLPLRAVSPLLTLENEQIPSPASVGSHSPEFLLNDSQIVLSWQSTVARKNVSQQALFEPTTHTWKKHTDGSIHIHQITGTGEVIARNAGRVAKAWFVSDDKDPRVLISTSTNAGEQFLMPIRVEDSRPIGTPDLVLLNDGTVFVSWPEHYNQNDTALWLRRISPGGSLSVPVLLAVLPAGQPSPQLALVKDFDDKRAQLLLAYALGQGDTAQIITRLLTVDPATNTKRANPCLTCPDPDEATRGYALKGRIVAISAERNTLTVQHGEITGVLSAATNEFKVDPSILKTAAVGTELFARVEKRGADWWLFSARLIVRP